MLACLMSVKYAKPVAEQKKVVLIIYGGRAADLWWQQNSKALLKLDNLTVINLPDTEALTQACTRNMNVSCTIQDAQMLVSHDTGSFEIAPSTLNISPS